MHVDWCQIAKSLMEASISTYNSIERQMQIHVAA